MAPNVLKDCNNSVHVCLYFIDICIVALNLKSSTLCHMSVFCVTQAATCFYRSRAGLHSDDPGVAAGLYSFFLKSGILCGSGSFPADLQYFLKEGDPVLHGQILQ